MHTRERTENPRRSRTALLAVSAATIAAALALAAPGAASATQTLSVSKLGSATGTVTSSPAGIDCGATCDFDFDEGEVVLLTGAGGANSLAVKWSGCDAITAQNRCEVTMSEAKAITATFDLLKRQLTVSKAGSGTGTVTSSPAGIECGATCTAGYLHGTAVTLTAISGPDSLPVAWSGCTSVSGEECNVTMSGAKAVTATFKLDVPLTVAKAGPGSGTVTSSPAGIDCGAGCTAGFEEGSTVTLTSESGPSSELAQWSGCDTVTAGNECKVTISAARSVTATYQAKPGVPVYTVTVQRTGTGSGTVSSPAGIECGSACTAEVVSKALLTLIATPAPGSVFDHWSGGGCTGSGTCEKPITSSHTVKAVFTATGTRTLAIAIAGNGSGSVKSKAAKINCSASCSPQVAAGKKIALSAKAASGSSFSGWSGACTGHKACKVQLSEAKSVTATFAKVPTPAPGIAAVAGKARVKGGKALVRVSCAAGASSCRGSLKLFAKLKGKGKKRVAIGSATFSLAPGSSTTLKVTLSAKAKQALKATGKLKARVSGEGIQGRAVRLRLGSK